MVHHLHVAILVVVLFGELRVAAIIEIVVAVLLLAIRRQERVVVLVKCGCRRRTIDRLGQSMMAVGVVVGVAVSKSVTGTSSLKSILRAVTILSVLSKKQKQTTSEGMSRISGCTHGRDSVSI